MHKSDGEKIIRGGVESVSYIPSREWERDCERSCVSTAVAASFAAVAVQANSVYGQFVV